MIPYLEDLDDEDYYFDEDPTNQVEPDDEYFNVIWAIFNNIYKICCQHLSLCFWKTGRNDETLPDLENLKERVTSFSPNQKVRVYTDIISIRENLTDDRYTLVDNIEQADVRFLINHFKDYKYDIIDEPKT